MRKAFLTERVPDDQRWFYHPEMQARVAQAEKDFAEGRSTRTETLEEAQAFLDSLKRLRLDSVGEVGLNEEPIVRAPGRPRT